MSDEKNTSLEHRLAALEKRVNDDLWVTNKSFFKRSLSIFGHNTLVNIIISAVCFMVFMFFLVLGLLAGSGNW